MGDKQRHDEFVERWANFVKNNPDKWKKIHSQFIDAQFIMAERFYKNLAKTKDGKKKIIEVFGIRNIEGYPRLK
jgi:hypothetical protein